MENILREAIPNTVWRDFDQYVQFITVMKYLYQFVLSRNLRSKSEIMPLKIISEHFRIK